MLNTIIKYLKENPGPGFNKINEITTHIYISDLENSNDIEMLKSFGIKTILDVSNIERNVDIFKKKRIDYINIELPKDLSNVSLEKFAEYINMGYDIIHASINNNHKILIHCYDGINISVIFVIFYLLKRFYLTNYLVNIDRTKQIITPDSYFLLEIIKFIKDRRLCIEPDANLIILLLKIEDAIKEFYTKKLEIEADEYKLELLKEKVDNFDEMDPYGDLEESVNLMDYLDYKYGGIEQKEKEKESKLKAEKKYDKLEDLFNI